MREILFRAKTVDDNCWHYGDIFHSSANPSQTRIHDYENHVNFEAIEDTLGQYTGLTDKNGVRIFEGDLIAPDSNAEPLIVKFEDGIYIAEHANHKDWLFIFEAAKWEIVGNIYDNPELVGGDDNAAD